MGGFCRKRGTFGLFAVNTAAGTGHTEGRHGCSHAQKKRAFGKGTIVTFSNQSASTGRGALKIFGALGIRGAKNPAKIGVFMVLAWILAIVGMISVVLSQLLGVSVNWLGWIVFAVTIAAAIYATKIRKDARNALSLIHI